MTAPGSILTLARQHLEAAMVGLVIVLLVVGGYLIYSHGKHVQAQADAVAQLETNRVAARNATAEVLRAIAPVKAENARLHAENDSLHVRGVSLETIANERHTAANLVNDRVHVKGDTASVTTDTGIVRLVIPELLAHEIANGKLATDSAFSAMERQHQNDVAQIAGLTAERDGQIVQIQLDSVVQSRYRAELSAAQAEIDVLKKQNAPRWTFKEGAIVGTTLTVAARIAAKIFLHW